VTSTHNDMRSPLAPHSCLFRSRRKQEKKKLSSHRIVYHFSIRNRWDLGVFLPQLSSLLPSFTRQTDVMKQAFLLQERPRRKRKKQLFAGINVRTHHHVTRLKQMIHKSQERQSKDHCPSGQQSLQSLNNRLFGIRKKRPCFYDAKKGRWNYLIRTYLSLTPVVFSLNLFLIYCDRCHR
jgi:hypothetical protein